MAHKRLGFSDREERRNEAWRLLRGLLPGLLRLPGAGDGAGLRRRLAQPHSGRVRRLGDGGHPGAPHQRVARLRPLRRRARSGQERLQDAAADPPLGHGRRAIQRRGGRPHHAGRQAAAHGHGLRAALPAPVGVPRDGSRPYGLRVRGHGAVRNVAGASQIGAVRAPMARHRPAHRHRPHRARPPGHRGGRWWKPRSRPTDPSGRTCSPAPAL